VGRGGKEALGVVVFASSTFAVNVLIRHNSLYIFSAIRITFYMKQGKMDTRHFVLFVKFLLDRRDLVVDLVSFLCVKIVRSTLEDVIVCKLLAVMDMDLFIRMIRSLFILLGPIGNRLLAMDVGKFVVVLRIFIVEDVILISVIFVMVLFYRESLVGLRLGAGLLILCCGFMILVRFIGQVLNVIYAKENTIIVEAFTAEYAALMYV
jgi:hypothetical protein